MDTQKNNISVKSILKKCIEDLGTVHVNVDQFESVILPIQKVRKNLQLLINADWHVGPAPEEPPEDIEIIPVSEETEPKEPVEGEPIE